MRPPSPEGLAARLHAASYGVGTSAGPCSSRCLAPRGWTLLFAGVRFGRDETRASCVLGPGRIPARNRAACATARRRLTTSWMRTLRARAFHGGAGRAFTSSVRSSDASLSPLGTGSSAPSPTSSSDLTRFSRTRTVRFTERPESSHRPLARRSHLLCREKMEERLEAPSVVSNSLPASADPHGVSASRTRRLAAPDRTTRHAVPVTFGRDACAPFRSDTGCYPGISAA